MRTNKLRFLKQDLVSKKTKITCQQYLCSQIATLDDICNIIGKESYLCM